MRILTFILMSIFAVSAFAFDDYAFNCDVGAFTLKSLPGTTKAPVSPVVGLKIKVLKQDVPLYLIKATGSNGDKNLFVTDWESPSILSQDGLDLLDLLSLFFNIDVANLQSIRAGLPTDLLDTFAYLELKDKSGAVTKLGFDGNNPSPCQ